MRVLSLIFTGLSFPCGYPFKWILARFNLVPVSIVLNSISKLKREKTRAYVMARY